MNERNRQGKRWTVREEKILLAGLVEQKDHGVIAEDLGRTIQSIQSRASMLGWSCNYAENKKNNKKDLIYPWKHPMEKAWEHAEKVRDRPTKEEEEEDDAEETSPSRPVRSGLLLEVSPDVADEMRELMKQLRVSLEVQQSYYEQRPMLGQWSPYIERMVITMLFIIAAFGLAGFAVWMGTKILMGG